MEQLIVEMRRLRAALWLLIGLGIAQFAWQALRAADPRPALAQGETEVTRVDVVRVAGHNIVGRKIPVEVEP